MWRNMSVAGFVRASLCSRLCICTGALLAAYAGLLGRARCTTHHDYIESLRQLAPAAEILENRIFVEDGIIYI